MKTSTCSSAIISSYRTCITPSRRSMLRSVPAPVSPPFRRRMVGAYGGIFRRCFAALKAKTWSKEASKYFSDSVPNFMQCASGMRDGTTKCAQLLRTFDSEPSDGDCHAILEIDIVNAFNSAARQAAFDTLAGTASRDYDQGRVKRGDALPSFLGLRHLFG